MLEKKFKKFTKEERQSSKVALSLQKSFRFVMAYIIDQFLLWTFLTCLLIGIICYQSQCRMMFADYVVSCNSIKKIPEIELEN